MPIVDLQRGNGNYCEQVAHLLNQAFPLADGYPTLEDAREEVGEMLEEGKLARILIEDGVVLGVIGAQPAYNGMAWEMHPLVVREGNRGNGYGTLLVKDLEDIIRVRGGGTLFLGTDDVVGQTSLGNTDLFPGVMEKLRDIRNISGHPFGFYQKLGFEVVGVLPDANGPGKPDIFMAKRIR